MDTTVNQNQNSKKYDHTKYTVDKTGRIRADFLFSYWIFAWFLVYYFLDTVAIRTGKASYTKWMYEHLNPIIALVIALAENLLTFFYMMYLNVGIIILLKYLAMMFFVKALPIYCIRNYPIHLFDNILAFLILFILYLIYLYTQGETLASVYTRTFTAAKNGSNKTPFYSLISSILRFFSF